MNSANNEKYTFTDGEFGTLYRSFGRGVFFLDISPKDIKKRLQSSRFFLFDLQHGAPPKDGQNAVGQQLEEHMLELGIPVGDCQRLAAASAAQGVGHHPFARKHGLGVLGVGGALYRFGHVEELGSYPAGAKGGSRNAQRGDLVP
jgi:hypothetical protein